MCVGIQRHADVRMPHQVLERLWIHAGLCHVAAVGMAADMGSDVWNLHPVDVIVPLDHTVKSVFPMHRHQRHSVLIREKESCMPIHHLLKSRIFRLQRAACMSGTFLIVKITAAESYIKLSATVAFYIPYLL